MKEDLILYYLNSFTSAEKDILRNARAIPCTYIDNATDKEWDDITSAYKALLPFGHLDGFKYEVAETGSYLIRGIFNRYIDDDTFVVTSRHEHDTVRDCLSRIKHKLEIVYEDIVALDMDQIYAAFKASGCTKFALYMVGTLIATGEIIPQAFFEKLKAYLDERNVQSLFILDDVHGMFITPRDYSLFDAVIYTCHSWICSFNMGMMFTRLPDQIGFRCKENPAQYLDLIKLIISKFDKIRQFKQVLMEYFAEELADAKTFDVFKRTTPHIFSLVTYGLVFTQDQYDALYKYDIRLGETLSYRNFARIRCQEFIIKDYDTVIKGLTLLKKTLRACKMVRDMSGIKPVFTDKKNITRKHLPDPHAALDVEL